MKLFKLHKEFREPSYNTLLLEAKTGDRITLFHGKNMPDEYVASTHGVFWQKDDRIFKNDEPEPWFTGSCEVFWDFQGHLLVMQYHAKGECMLSEYTSPTKVNEICLVNATDIESLDSLEICLDDCGEIYLREGEKFFTCGDELKTLLTKPVDAWGANTHGCIVEFEGNLWRITDPDNLALYFKARNLGSWKTYEKGAVIAEREHGLSEFDGKTTTLLTEAIPDEWCVTAKGIVIKLEDDTFSTLDGQLVYDGPFYAWRPHPHGVLIERDGDLVLAVVK